MTTMTISAPTYKAVSQPFTLEVTRRVYAVDCITGARCAYFVRNFNLVG